VQAPEILFHKARQMRRTEFDIACRERASALGAWLLHGLASEIEVGTGGAKHRVVAKVGGEKIDIRSRWIVDATGRARPIGKKVTRYIRPDKQRSTFWFRLRNFQPFFEHIDVHRRRQWQFDPWLTTHHFMGRGYWIWCIPLEIGQENLCSMGFTYRPDILMKFFRDRDEDAESLWVLAAEASAAIGPPYTQEGFDRGPDLDALLNLRFDCAREDVMEVMTRMFARRREMRMKLLAMNGNKKLLREIPRLISETVRPRLLRLLPVLRPTVFAALRPPLPEQYARWTGPDRNVPEPDLPYVGGLVRSGDRS
jgi:hypothetical protein